jgi:peptidoglycan-associated lipoprotein
MKLAKLVTLVFIGITFSNSLFAQKNYMKEADKKFNNGLYLEAIEAYKKASTKEKKKAAKAEIIFKTAECYRMLNDPKNSELWYSKAIKAKFPDPKATLLMAEAKKTQERYNDAIIDFNEYAKLVPGDSRGVDGAKSCELAQKWKDNPTRYIVSNVMSINSKFSDFSPVYADKKSNNLYFTSMREGSTGNRTDATFGQSFSDIYEVKLDKKGSWSQPMPIGEPVNSKLNEGSCILNKKRSKIWFTRCPEQAKRNLGSIIFEAEKKGTGWGEPKPIVLCADSFTAGHPAISPDETTLFFASDMPGGAGGKDIWMTTYDKKGGKWGNPVNAGFTINTPGDEMFPFIDSEGNLYFASNGQIGMGGFDLFKAAKSGDGFAVAVNLQYPINSAADDFGIVTDGKMEKGYLSSNRAGGKGSDDIYSFGLPPLIFNVSGLISNVDTKEKIVGATVKMVGSDGSSIETNSDETGTYRFDMTPDGARVIKKDVTYTLNVSKEDHLGDKSEFTTVGLEVGTDFVKDMAIKPIKKEVAIRLPDILYDLAKWDLKPQYQDSLMGLVKTLDDNSNITIELGSHTDTRGSDKDNAVLSQNRAQSVVDFLISKGIAGDRLVAKGYGETKPLVSDNEIKALKTDEEKEAAHQKNRRTDFKILRQDYVPKEDPNAIKGPKVEDASEDE